MKANELMVGDWLRIVDDDTDQSFETRITGVSELGNIYAPLPEGEHAYPFSVDCIEPIPITPEFLEKNGFKVMHGFGYSEKYPTYGWGYHKEARDYASVDVTFYNEPIAGVSTLVRMETNSSKGDGVNTFHSCDCDYVHQLQHALRLCGIEKEIEL